LHLDAKLCAELAPRNSSSSSPDLQAAAPDLIAGGRQKGLDFLASGENPAIYRAISHGNMAQKAVRWQPGREGSFAHTFPEEPTGELDYGVTRFFHASAA
jgi:hypothetical protein